GRVLRTWGRKPKIALWMAMPLPLPAECHGCVAGSRAVIGAGDGGCDAMDEVEAADG
ncbi:hypothetical protein U1Q18_034041, partial [Sarracenia purpurea var. burkii]